MDITTAVELETLIDDPQDSPEEDGPLIANLPDVGGLTTAQCRELVGQKVLLTTIDREVEIISVDRRGVLLQVGELMTFRSPSSLRLL